MGLCLRNKLARIVIIRTDISLTSKNTCKSECGSEEPTHYSGIAPDRAKFMPHRKSRSLTRLARQRSACDALNYARSTLCCDCGLGCLCPVRNRLPVLKVGISTLCRNSDGSPTFPAGLAKRAKIILLPAEGLALSAIARCVEVGRRIVRTWIQCFLNRRIPGLFDKLGRGRSLSQWDLHELAHQLEAHALEKLRQASGQRRRSPSAPCSWQTISLRRVVRVFWS
jgi:hypothetical protein